MSDMLACAVCRRWTQPDALSEDGKCPICVQQERREAAAKQQRAQMERRAMAMVKSCLAAWIAAWDDPLDLVSAAHRAAPTKFHLDRALTMLAGLGQNQNTFLFHDGRKFYSCVKAPGRCHNWLVTAIEPETAIAIGEEP